MNKKNGFAIVVIFLGLTILFASMSMARADFQVAKLPSTLNFMGNDMDSSGTLWAGDKNFGLWKSIDRGASFQLVYTLPHEPPRSDNPYSGLVWNVFVDSRNYIFASGGGANNSLYRSTNGGASFGPVLNANDTNNQSFYIAMTEDNSSNLYVAPYTIGTTIQPQILKSTNGGSTWTKITNFNTFHFHNIKYNPYNGYLYAITGERYGSVMNFNDTEKIFRSKDSGTTWSLIVDRNDVLGTVYLAMTFVGNYVYVGQDYPSRNCQIQRFLDEGQAGLCTPQVVYTPPNDGCMPFISGVLFNGSLVFGNCAELQNGTTRVVSSLDGVKWNILISTNILSIEPRWNILTTHPRSSIFATLKSGFSYQIVDMGPQPTPSASPIPSPTPTPTPMPTPTLTPTPTIEPSPTPQPTEPPTPASTQTPTYTQSPITAPTTQPTVKHKIDKPTPTPIPTPTANPTLTHQPTTPTTTPTSTQIYANKNASNGLFLEVAIAASIMVGGTILSVTLLKKRGIKR
jgi:hypothetical protein